MAAGTGVTERWARATAAHPRRTIGVWVALVVLALVAVVTFLQGLSSDAHVVGNPESTRAANVLRQAFPPTLAEQSRRVSDVIIVNSARFTTSSPEFRTKVTTLAARLHTDPYVSNINGVVNGAPIFVSANGHAALIQLYVPSDDHMGRVETIVHGANGDGFVVGVTGDHTVGYDFGQQSAKDLQHGELAFGLPAALIVLLLVFGAVTGALIPVLTAVLSIVVGLGVVAVISQFVTLSVFIVNMLIGMGLALGIDYSLFVISRYREERLANAAQHDAIARAGATASRAVLFSGSTFVVALFGMLMVPTTIMRSLAAGAIIVGIISVASALTLLPALLGALGDRVNSPRVPFVGRNLGRAERTEGRVWRAIVDRVVSRPVVSLVVSVGLLLLAASPILGLRVGSNGVSTLPSSLPSRVGYDMLQASFPKSDPYPVNVVVQGGNDQVTGIVANLRRQLATNPNFGPGSIRTAPAAGVVLLSVPITGDVNSPQAAGAVRHLRQQARHNLAGTGATVLVGGHTAEQVDFYDAVTNPTPYVLFFVLGLSLILLTVAFRSVVVALVSIVLNLLAVGAAYGLVTLVFLKGHGAAFFGFQHVAVVDAWVPLFLFSVLFGLSMDYQVFLMSRIKERYDVGLETREAVASGVASTARIITGAALIIVVVFTGFAFGKLVMFQQMGFGVAVALLIDATLIRSVVLPSTLALLGDKTWYLPRWLNWLPHVQVESAPAVTPEPAVQV
jgi:RND superfamily putative drug exporter